MMGARNDRPTPRTAENWAANVPAALIERDQWVVWRYQLDKDRRDWTKVPYRADDPESHASTTNPATWGTFAAAKATHDRRALRMDVGRLDGVGFVFGPDDPFVGIDLDLCLDDDGNVRSWAAPVLRELPTYAEVSPGGRGVKLIAVGSLDGPGHKTAVGEGKVEMYDRGRFFTITGLPFPDHPNEVVDLSGPVAELYRKLWPPQTTNGKPSFKVVREAVDLADDDLLARAFASKNGARIKALYDGDAAGHGGDESSADMALCCHLAFWLGRDATAIDRAFRASGLMRPKWDDRRGAETYGAWTIAKAIDWTDECYAPPVECAIVVGGRKVVLGRGAAVPEGADAPPAADEAFDDPHRLARSFADRRRQGGFGTLWHWRDEWHAWDGNRYSVVSDAEIKADVTAHCKAEFDAAALVTGKPAAKVTRTAVNNVLGCLQSVAMLHSRAYPERPAWIDPSLEGVPPPAEVVPTQNTLLHLSAWVEGRPYAMAPTPRFFSPNCLAYAFEHDAPRPDHWLAFLASLWPDDPESIACLQEWFGYLLTSDTGLQKMLAVIGPPRSGKGTIARVLTALVGRENVASPTLSSMASNFGLAPLIGKMVAVFPDARLSGRQDSQVVVERLLSITGEDEQTIDRKHLPSWEGRLATRFVLLSNELPRLGDSSGAITSRMIVLRLVRSFVGREDHKTAERILKELPSVLLWAVVGWARLRERGRFVQPQSSVDLVEEMGELASPIASFVADRCEIDPNGEVTIDALYVAWVDWCKDQGRDHAGDKAGLGRNLRAAVPGIETPKKRTPTGRVRLYRGLRLATTF